MTSRRDLIFATVDDLIADFLYYGRKEDEDLPRGAIEEAIGSGEITTEEIVARFQAQLTSTATA